MSCSCRPLLATATSNPFLLSAKVMISCTSLSSSTTTTRSGIYYPRLHEYPCISIPVRSEEHTSELQSHLNLVCRLLLEKKKNKMLQNYHTITRMNICRDVDCMQMPSESMCN